MEKIVETGMKIDFHIHSIASKHKESDDCVDLSTIDNIDVLIKKLNDRKINICSISDHDNFDIKIYQKLKNEENKGSIRKVFPSIEFSVSYDGKILHIITIFDDDGDENLIKKIQGEVFDSSKGVPLYDDQTLMAFSETKFLDIIKNIGLNVVMIAHQKETLSSTNVRNHDAKSLGDEKFDELVFIDYFESFEFKNRRNEIFNKYYIEKNKEKYKDNALRFITGSDCHNWNNYPIEDDEFAFTYLKCLPTFRGLAMSVTNVKRINFVNNFFSASDIFLPSLKLNIKQIPYEIALSKGINVIIGDNSIGKSLLIHKITNYAYLNDSTLKINYEDYLKENDISIISTISKDDISKFDGQGSIRKMFENKAFNADSFLKNFFPPKPIVKKFVDLYKDAVENYISNLINKKELQDSKDKLCGFKIINFDNYSKSLNLKNVPQTYIDTINTKMKKIGKIVEHFESIILLIKNILANSYYDIDDKAILENNQKDYLILIEKYKKKINACEFEISKINSINSIFDKKSKEYIKTMTDETEKISSYENLKESFINNIIDYYYKAKKETVFKPNIEKEKLPINSSKVGDYRFVVKSSVKEISNEHLLAIICGVLGKSIKDVNLIDSSTIPDKFNERGRETSYLDKLKILKTELFSTIDNIFEVKEAINDANDKDVSKELSAGFNSKIYFDLISNQINDNRIYIIDQPEDDVSQPSIKKNILGDFSDMSKHKQIIMITHNPQFIVNLDVDNVIFIGKDENNELFIQNGALEYFDNKYDILKIVAENIEGGISSINERWKRYDKNI